ncbi:MAG TPA: caspase family protein, partial [Xanthomonadales bacterium]|nr:caspase family protein [Xanthomonadales bacterium]
EEGLGVPKDLAKALNLYREGSGITDDDIVFASTVTAQAEAAQAEISSLRSTVEQQRAEAEQLRRQIDDLKRQVGDRKQALNSAQRELKEARAKLVAQQASIASPQQADELNRLKAQLEAQEQKLAAERATLEADKAAFAGKVESDKQRLAQLKAEQAALEQKVAAPAAGADTAAVKKDLDRVRAAASELALALDDAYGKLSSMEAQLAANQSIMAAEQMKFDAERQKLQAALAASQQDRELLLLLEQQLGEKQREVTQQRDQIASLERQIGAATPSAGSSVALAGLPGPLVEIIEPALTVTRGRPAAMVRGASGTSDVLGKVVASAGIGSVEINGKTIAVAPNGLFKVSIPVIADGSTVQIAAIDKAGTRTNLEFLLLPAPGAARPGAVAAAPSKARRLPSGVNLGRYYAVVIGNNDYSTYPKLSSAVNDAQKVGALLKSRYGVDTRVLVNASRFEILSALNEMRELLKPEDNLMVYFAGHGELDKSTREGYWLPVDAQAGNPSSWISNRAISDILNTMQARHVMVVADSCYSGSMTRASVPTFSTAMADDKWAEWVRTMAQSRSRTALTSGGLAPVPDSSGSGNSLFAKAFLAALEDNNQLLEGQKLFRDITATLALAVTESTLIQVPEYAPIKFAGHEAGEFFLNPRG